jgi:hypothetical protein
MSAYGFHNLYCLFVKAIQNKVSACFYEITNCEIPSSNPLQRACFRLSVSRLCLKKLFRNLPVILKIVPKACCEFTLEKIGQ